MRRRIWALAASVLAVTGGCSGSARAASHPTTTSTVAGPDPYVIPAVITPAYVNAVFAVLNHVSGDATRALLKAHRVTGLVRTYLRAIYSDPLYAKEVDLAAKSVPAETSNIRIPTGDVVTKVTGLLYSSSTCIFVQTSVDYSGVLINPGKKPADGYWRLTLKIPANDPEHLNQTPWALSFNAVYLTPTSIPDQCIDS